MNDLEIKEGYIKKLGLGVNDQKNEPILCSEELVEEGVGLKMSALMHVSMKEHNMIMKKIMKSAQKKI